MLQMLSCNRHSINFFFHLFSLPASTISFYDTTRKILRKISSFHISIGFFYRINFFTPFVILSCYFSSLSSIFSPNQMFSSPPIKMQYMQKYIHIMINMIVVRLPYILENPLNTSTYTENTQDMTIHPNVENTAPGSCLLYISLLFGRNL